MKNRRIASRDPAVPGSRQRARSLTTALALGIATACVPIPPVTSSAVVPDAPLPTSTAPVTISATSDPAGGRQLGIVEATGRQPAATLELLVAELRARVAGMGGNYGRIDSIATRHEMVTETYDYDCSTDEFEVETQTVTTIGPDGMPTFTTQTVPVTKHVSKTCTGERSVEVATTTLLGRAFLTRGRMP